MKCEIVNITPALAKSWLEQNANFREPIPSRIEQYAVDITKGWDENGETIKFNTRDELVDGQNRLYACIKCGKPFVSVVVYGVKDDRNIDVGLKRQLHEYLKHHGVEQYTREYAGALRQLCRYRNGSFIVDCGTTKISNNMALEIHKQHPNFKDSAQATYPVWKLLACSISCTLHYIFTQKDAELARKFFISLATGEGMKLDDAVYLLREKLIENKTAKLKLSYAQKLALTIIAWNYWRAGKAVRLLRWNESGPFRQNFPTIE